MLSVANPPDPPCSCKDPALNSDEKGYPSEIRPASSPEADPADGPDEAQPPHFSIRDYVFASRTKDVGTNWPFPRQYLQLCVKHGIRDLLPPFEPPDLVRARLSEAEHLILCSEVEGTQTEVPDAVEHGFSPPTQESVLGSSHQPQNPSSEDKSTAVRATSSEEKLLQGDVESKVTGHDHTKRAPSSDSRFPGSVQEARSTISESSSEVEVTKPPRSAEYIKGLLERSVKKCRLIVKFGGAPESNRSEDIVSNFSSLSDPMASKVCPVCKTFSSSSNTTLNAHIDQCLSAESSARQNATKLSQHKVKPRKKRSMEDICATAPHCTLEDLDRRNGTNWALDLTCMAQKNGASCTTEGKQPRVSPLRATGVERKGAVYVDSKGTKLLILSKFNDAQSAAAVNCSGPKKCLKELNNKSSPLGKKKCFPPKYRKYLQAKVQRKKSSSFSHLQGEIHKECRLHARGYHEEGMISHVSNAPEKIKVGKPGTLGHWICSKRSSLLKHLNSISSQRKPKNPSSAIIRHMSMDSDQSTSCDYFAVGGCPQKFCKSSDEILSPPKTRHVNVLSDAALAFPNQGKDSANLPDKNARSVRNNPSTSDRIMQKLTRSTEKCVSSAKSKRVEMRAISIQKSGQLQNLRKSSVYHHSKPHKVEKDSRKSLSMDGQQCTMEAMKCDELVHGVVSKKLRKHRFAEKPHKAIKRLPLEFAEGLHGSSSVHVLGSASNNVTSGMHQSNIVENVVSPETGNTLDHVSTHQHNTMDSDRADVFSNASEEGEFFTLNHTQLEGECCHAEGTEYDAQAEVPANMDSITKYPSEKSFHTCGYKIVISEDHEASICDRLDPHLSPEHEGEPTSANEATIEASLPKLLGDQGMHPGVTGNDDVRQDIWQAGQIELSVQDGYCSEIQNMEYQADVASIQGPSACLTSPMDKVCELSAVTSGRSVTAEIHNMIVDGEPSGSPVSATSTISHLSAEDLKSKDAEREPSEEPVVIQKKMRPESRNLGLLVDDCIRGTERTDLEKNSQKLKAMTSAQDPEKSWGGQPCCCSRRESIPSKSRMLRQSTMDGMLLPTTSPLYIRPAISSSGSYSHSTSELNAIPMLYAPTDSTSIMTYPDFTVGLPIFGSFGSASPSSHIQPQSSSSPVLRLMGKNLMVMNNEERPVQQQNQTAPCSSENTSNGKYMSLLGFSSSCTFSNPDGIQYQPHQSLEGSMLTGQHPLNIQAPVALPAEQIGSSAGTLLQSIEMMKTDSHARHKMFDRKPNSSAMYNSAKVCIPYERLTPIPVTQAPTPETEIIVIDDSSEHENEPSGSLQNPASNMVPPFPGSDIRQLRSFCYPSQNPFQPRDLGCGIRPGFPISYPRRDTNSTKWGGTTESSGPLLPRYFMVPSQSAGQVAKTLYHSPSIQ